MRNPFRRTRRAARTTAPAAWRRRPERVRPVGAGNAGRHHRAAEYGPLCSGRVRDRRFSSARRGLDPGEVHAFLHRLADDLAALTAELDRTRDENARVKQALRQWQSRFAPGAWR